MLPVIKEQNPNRMLMMCKVSFVSGSHMIETNGKDLVSCQSLCPNHLYMHFIFMYTMKYVQIRNQSLLNLKTYLHKHTLPFKYIFAHAFSNFFKNTKKAI